MTSQNIKDLEDKLALLQAELNGRTPPKRDLVWAIFEPTYMGERPGQSGVLIPLTKRGAPDNYRAGERVLIPREVLSDPWWRLAPD